MAIRLVVERVVSVRSGAVMGREAGQVGGTVGSRTDKEGDGEILSRQAFTESGLRKLAGKGENQKPCTSTSIVG